MLSALPITAILVAFVANIVTSLGVHYGITEDNTVRGVLQLAASSIVAFVMTEGLTNFIIVATVPIWGMVFVTILVVLFTFLIGLLVIVPLARGGYLGNFYKWSFQLHNDEEFQEATKLLDDQEVREISQISAGKEHFREQVVEEAGINED